MLAHLCLQRPGVVCAHACRRVHALCEGLVQRLKHIRFLLHPGAHISMRLDCTPAPDQRCDHLAMQRAVVTVFNALRTQLKRTHNARVLVRLNNWRVSLRSLDLLKGLPVPKDAWSVTSAELDVSGSEVLLVGQEVQKLRKCLPAGYQLDYKPYTTVSTCADRR